MAVRNEPEGPDRIDRIDRVAGVASRRDVLRAIGRAIAFGFLAITGGWLSFRRNTTGRVQASATGGTVWQLDPEKCVQCGQCATKCVLRPSAVKCLHAYKICGYCKLCFGYFQPGVPLLTEAAENQLCPVGAIKRTFVESPYYEYTIDEELCVGCGKCVAGCTTFGNGSLHLQVRQSLCLNCNECAIAVDCPANAYSRISADAPYKIKGRKLS